MSKLAEKALQIAVSRIGIHEQPAGTNSGPEVDTYMQSIGLAPHHGFSWCMAFQFDCFKTAAAALNVPNTAVKTGGCLYAWQNAKPEQKAHTPSVGSVYILDLGHGHGHTGIVEKINADGTITGIEGNSNNNGSADGEAVVRHIRKQGAPIIGYLNY